jgi:serine/threonine-protein kinase PknG
MSSGSECARPGCPGVVRDGFCDYCGFAPSPRPRASKDLAAPTPEDLASPTPADLARPTPADLARPTPADLAGPTPDVAPDSARHGTDSDSTAADTTAESTTSGQGRSVAYNALEMAGVPLIPYRDPKLAVVPDYQVDKGERSLTPDLRPGELVSGQYEVQGCLTHGGLGWIYLAYDQNVGHWVVLKGMLDIGHEASHRVPAAERAALAAVNHPNIVKIHNFVRHPASEIGKGGRTTQNYIVMEYVGGRSLKELLDERMHEEGPQAVLPVDYVIAYGIEMLRALDYLHGRGLLYCDLKPANVMQCEQWLTLIDLGAARRMDSTSGQIMWTPGYGAPEVTAGGPPSISSDLYTVGRTMAALSLPIPEFTSTYASSLPARENVPQLMEFESYDRLLRRATHPDPRQRFRDAAEMIEQLYGVLREVVSAPRNAEPWPVPSTLFGQERYAVGTENIGVDRDQLVLGSLDPASAAAALPVPIKSTTDGAAGLADLVEREPEEIVRTLISSPESSPETPSESSPEAKLVLAGALLDLSHHQDEGAGGRRAGAERLLNELAKALPGDWRVAWSRGIAALTGGQWEKAKGIFDDLYTRMPGEAAPKLALAFCCEGAGERSEAARRYESVWRTDRGYVSAAFGLARVRLLMGDRAGAVKALDDVSSLSRHYGAAQLGAMVVAVRGRPPADLTEADLLAAQQRLEESRVVDNERRNQLVAELLEAGLEWVRAGYTARPDARLHGARLTEDELRRKLEATYKALARLAEDADAKHALVAKANAVRSWTLV